MITREYSRALLLVYVNALRHACLARECKESVRALDEVINSLRANVVSTHVAHVPALTCDLRIVRKREAPHARSS